MALQKGIIKIFIKENNVVHAEWPGLLTENVNEIFKTNY